MLQSYLGATTRQVGFSLKANRWNSCCKLISEQTARLAISFIANNWLVHCNELISAQTAQMSVFFQQEKLS
jgi:hypothetical protein